MRRRDRAFSRVGRVKRVPPFIGHCAVRRIGAEGGTRFTRPTLRSLHRIILIGGATPVRPTRNGTESVPYRPSAVVVRSSPRLLFSASPPRAVRRGIVTLCPSQPDMRGSGPFHGISVSPRNLVDTRPPSCSMRGAAAYNTGTANRPSIRAPRGESTGWAIDRPGSGRSLLPAVARRAERQSLVIALLLRRGRGVLFHFVGVGSSRP